MAPAPIEKLPISLKELGLFLDLDFSSLVFPAAQVGGVGAYADLNAKLAAMQAQIDSLSAGGGLQHASIQYVTATGADGNSGANYAAAKRTPQAAYAALPAPGQPGFTKGGGFVLIAPGPYDVGTGVVMADGKPARFAAAVGGRHLRHPVDPDTDYNVRIYSSGTPTALFSFSGISNILQGSEWQGLYFDLTGSATTTAAIYAESINHGYITDCGCNGISPNSSPKYMVRAVAGAGGDSSWWRFRDNNTRNCGLAYMGTATDSNCNQHSFIGNDVNMGSSPGIRIQSTNGGGHRNVTFGNNLEGAGIGILCEGARGNFFLGDGGELSNPFIKLVASGGNLVAPIGSGTATPGGGQVLVEDDGTGETQTANVILAPTMIDTFYGKSLANLNAAITFGTDRGSMIVTPHFFAARPEIAHPATNADVIAALTLLNLTA